MVTNKGFYSTEDGTDKEIRKKLETIKERPGLGTLLGVFIPNSSDVCNDLVQKA